MLREILLVQYLQKQNNFPENRDQIVYKSAITGRHSSFLIGIKELAAAVRIRRYFATLFLQILLIITCLWHQLILITAYHFAKSTMLIEWTVPVAFTTGVRAQYMFGTSAQIYVVGCNGV
jgi:hypothetical protein